MTTQPKTLSALKSSLLAEFEKDHKGYFAIESFDCKKCGHNKGSHYWNGGGNQDCSGYDTCHICGCIDYDEKEGFEVVVRGYDNRYKTILSFLSHALDTVAEKTAEEIDYKGYCQACLFTSEICKEDPCRVRKIFLSKLERGGE